MRLDKSVTAALLAGAAAVALAFGASRMPDRGEGEIAAEQGSAPEPAPVAQPAGPEAEFVEAGAPTDTEAADDGGSEPAAAPEAEVAGAPTDTEAADEGGSEPPAAPEAEATDAPTETEAADDGGSEPADAPEAAVASRSQAEAEAERQADDAEIARLAAALAERDTALAELRDRLETLERELGQQRAEVAALEAQLVQTAPSPIEVEKFLGTGDEEPRLAALRAPAAYPVASSAPPPGSLRPLPAPRQPEEAAAPNLEEPAALPDEQTAAVAPEAGASPDVPTPEGASGGRSGAEPSAPAGGIDDVARGDAQAIENAAAAPILLDRIQFETASGALSPEALARAADLAAEVAALEGPGTIRVTGHTDRTGPPAVNERLARERAEAVAAALAEAGIPPERIVVAAAEDLPVPTPPGVPEPRNRAASVWLAPDK